MYNHKVTRVENKSSRRKLNQKIETLAKKSVELSIQHNCNILLVIYSEHNRKWVQYCNSDPESLFFGLQSAKEHLEKIEQYDNTNYHRLLGSIDSVENSISPKPTKNLKISEKDSFCSQPIKIAESTKEFFKSSASTISTEFTLPNPPELFPPKINELPKLASEFFPTPHANSNNENEPSTDFDFESYFVSDNNS